MSEAVKARTPTHPPDLGAFIAGQGRLPRLGDEPPPWRYRGWLLPYVLLRHALVPAVADRWGYHLRTLEAGRLLDEPIPQVRFGPPGDHVFGLLHDWARLVGGDCGGWGDFRTLVDWLCWGLALSKEPPRFYDEVHEKLYRRVDLTPLLERPYDYLGQHVASNKARGWNPTAFYPTPHEVAELMARMLLHDAGKDGRDPRTLSVCDPCVGSGRMLLHAANVSLNLWGQDIDPLAVALCKVNGALYAPWIAFPLPPAVLGLTDPLLKSTTSGRAVPVYRVDDRGQGLLFPL